VVACRHRERSCEGLAACGHARTQSFYALCLPCAARCRFERARLHTRLRPSKATSPVAHVEVSRTNVVSIGDLPALEGPSAVPVLDTTDGHGFRSPRRLRYADERFLRPRRRLGLPLFAFQIRARYTDVTPAARPPISPPKPSSLEALPSSTPRRPRRARLAIMCLISKSLRRSPTALDGRAIRMPNEPLARRRPRFKTVLKLSATSASACAFFVDEAYLSWMSRAPAGFRGHTPAEDHQPLPPVMCPLHVVIFAARPAERRARRPLSGAAFLPGSRGVLGVQLHQLGA